jgi:uncharacterized protein (UPF0332 family)
MQPEYVILCNKRLNKAKTDWESSVLLCNNHLLLQAMNRAYYAVFHATRAFLALDNFDSRKHAGIIAFFNEHYIKTGIFEKELSRILMGAEKVRNLSDYDDFFNIEENDVKKQIANVQHFINTIETYIKSRIGKQ